jgi:hypothetical protein
MKTDSAFATTKFEGDLFFAKTQWFQLKALQYQQLFLCFGLSVQLLAEYK